MKEKVYIILNSTILYVVAFLITTMLHECLHAIFGVLYNSEPVLHHNFVEHLSSSNLSISQQVTIAVAGPIMSLIQGFLAGLAFIKSNRQKLFHLFLLWFSVLGFNNFLGYMMTGPLFKVGDIGEVYDLLQTPVFLQIVFALLAALALLYIAYKLTRPFLEFSYEKKWVVDSKSKKNFSFSILILPWLIGSATITILYFPIIALVSIIYPVMSGMVFIFPWQNAQRIESVKLSDDENLRKVSIVSIAILIVLILLFKLVLAPGIAF